VVSVSRTRRTNALSRVTLFAVPKPFLGRIGTIQRNAIESWVRLRPACRVVLLGDDEGTADVARELNVHHIPEVPRNEFGTPLLTGVFEAARALDDNAVMCYVNSDIILLDDFLRALGRIHSKRARYLMVGQCWNLELDAPVDFDDGRWQTRLLQLATAGRRRGKSAIDYFAFPGDLYDAIPPFAIGRTYFDNWLLWKAGVRGATIVDATPVVDAVHQHHDYSHVAGGRDEAFSGPEAAENLRLGGGLEHSDTIRDASLVLTRRRLRRPESPLTLEYHRNKWFRPAVWHMYAVTRPVRHRLGIRAGMFGARRTRLR